MSAAAMKRYVRPPAPTARRTERGYGVPPARLAWGSPASPAQSTSRASPLQLVGHQPSGPLGRLAKVLIAVMGDVEEQVVVHRDSVIDGCCGLPENDPAVFSPPSSRGVVVSALGSPGEGPAVMVLP